MEEILEILEEALLRYRYMRACVRQFSLLIDKIFLERVIVD